MINTRKASYVYEVPCRRWNVEEASEPSAIVLQTDHNRLRATISIGTSIYPIYS